MNASYGMAVDTRTCVGCNACVISCKTENAVPEGFIRNWVTTGSSGEFPRVVTEVRSERCNHCEDAPCVAVCPTGASYNGPGGTVQIDPDKCSGCKACIAACPYGARYIDPEVGAADKCTFCMHRNDGTGAHTTACQDVCPTDSIYFGDLNDPESAISRALATREHYTLLPEAGTKPKHFYLR